MIGAYLLMVPQRQSYAQAFHEFSRVLTAAKSARFQCQKSIVGEDDETVVWYFQFPGRYRVEGPKLSFILDVAAGKEVLLNSALKMATFLNFRGSLTEAQEPEYFERLRALLASSEDSKDDEFQSLGEQIINGQRAIGFRLDHPLATISLWGNPKTGMPIRIETKWNGSSELSHVLSDFEFDLKLSEALFDLTPPSGYKTQSINFYETEITEQDLLIAFRFASDADNGKYPVALDQIGLDDVIAKFIAPRMKDKKEDSGEVERALKDIGPFFRGYQFAVEDLPKSADAHYAGQGVKFGTANRPIFWYKPTGSNTYRVIDAELTVQDAEVPPEVPGAKRLKKSSKSTNKHE
jgi:outer membrane lipoprotein-sorting protein